MRACALWVWLGGLRIEFVSQSLGMTTLSTIRTFLVLPTLPASLAKSNKEQWVGPLVKLEADYDKKMKESQVCLLSGIFLRFSC